MRALVRVWTQINFIKWKKRALKKSNKGNLFFKKSVLFGKSIKSFFFQDQNLDLKGSDRKERLKNEIKFINQKYDETESKKSLKIDLEGVETPLFVKKMRTHFWNIHQFFCDLINQKLNSELENLKEFNVEELETLRFRLNKELNDSKSKKINFFFRKNFAGSWKGKSRTTRKVYREAKKHY